MFLVKVLPFLLKQKKIPQNEEEIMLWALSLPFHLWNRVCRFEGFTFYEYYLKQNLGDLEFDSDAMNIISRIYKLSGKKNSEKTLDHNS